MKKLYEFHDTILKNVSDNYFRSLLQEIDWEQRLIAIKGSRGVGKTTLILQYLKYFLKNREGSLYITADHHWFNLLQRAKIVQFIIGQW